MQAPNSATSNPEAAAVSAASLLKRARELAPTFRERVAETAALRKLPDTTVQDMQDAGFFKILQPKRYGGYELDPIDFYDVQRTLAAGCPSSAWVLGVLAVHNWQLALFDKQAQQDVWGKDPSTLISSSYAPTGKVEAVDGGFRISGRWSFSSGCDHCQWIFLGGFAPGGDGPPDMRTFLVPRSDYSIDDNWHTVGLQGTGSKDIVVDGAFVPAYRTHRMVDGFKCDSPGNKENTAPLFRLPFGQVFVRSVSTSSIGMAEGALDAYLGVARSRVAAGDGSKVAENPSAQMVAARASSLVDEAKTILRRNMTHMMDLARAGESIDLDTRIAYRFDSSNAVMKCVEAVDLLFTESGGRAIFLDHPLLRFFLDVHSARAHYANNPDKPGWNFGSVQLGLRNKDFFL